MTEHRDRGKTWHEGRQTWTCRSCGLDGEPGKPDPCLGSLPGVIFACCGHGIGGGAGYVTFENGVSLRPTSGKFDVDDKTIFFYGFDGESLPEQGPNRDGYSLHDWREYWQSGARPVVEWLLSLH